MSTSPDPSPSSRPEDEIVGLLSRWLAFHLGNAALRARLQAIGADRLSTEQAKAVEELLTELAAAREGARGELEMLVRETLEALALGG